MSIFTVETAKIYLAATKFKPHPSGNDYRYGLNLIGCQSIIKLHGEIWVFLHTNNNNDAVYCNVEGNLFLLEGYGNDDITRMDEE